MNSLPLNQEVYCALKAKIENGTYPENSALPAERVLSAIFHVSRSTVRHSLDALKKEGLIVKLHGNGNFVKPRVFEQKLTNFHSFATSLKAQDVAIKNRILDYSLIENDAYLVSLELEQKKEAPYWNKLVRLRSAGTSPLMIETSYLPQNRFQKIDLSLLLDGSLYSYLEEFYRMQITYAHEIFAALLPNANERLLLQLPLYAPCLQFERFCYENGALIAIHRTIVRGDKFKFKAMFCADNVS